MYTQAMDLMAREAKPKVVKSAEELAREEAFEARIAAGDFIEAKDWMRNAALVSNFTLLATSADRNGKVFVAQVRAECHPPSWGAISATAVAL